MVQGTVDGDIESAEGIGPPPPPPTQPPMNEAGLGPQSLFTPDTPQEYGNYMRPQPKPQISLEAVKLSEDDVREALAGYVLAMDGCCIDKGPLRNMTITEIKPVMVIHYRLETFNEWRGTGWTTCPYYGGNVDGPGNGRTPSGWDIEMFPDEQFSNHVKTYEMPHTATASMCHQCNGSGSQSCDKCVGTGTKTCARCMGRGTVKEEVRRGDQVEYQDKRCGSCNNGMQSCGWCSGGARTCSNCAGRGQIKRFLMLYVKFRNVVKEYVFNDPSFPDELVQDVDGDLMFQETGMQVEAVKDFPQPDINKASQELIAQYNKERFHQNTESERQLGQRHSIRGVPVNNVRYRYQGIPRNFWVYGRERAVHCPDYPVGSCALCCAHIAKNKRQIRMRLGSVVFFLIAVVIIVVVVVTQYL